MSSFNCGGESAGDKHHPEITGIEGTGPPKEIDPRPEDLAAYQAEADKVEAISRIDSRIRELVITGTNLSGVNAATAVGQNGQGTIEFEILEGGTDTMVRLRFPHVLNVTAGGLFALTLVTAAGDAEAQVFFLQGQDGVCSGNTIEGDLTVNGSIQATGDVTVAGDSTVGGTLSVERLTVEGSYELPECPPGYERDPAADASIIVCVHPTRGDEMVRVGDFWVDRYEATVFENADCTGHAFGSAQDDWDSLATNFPKNGNWSEPLYACSVPGEIPSRWLTWFQAEAACASQGKHLCSNDEWQVAAQGTVDPGVYDGTAGGACHTGGADPRVAGSAGTIPGDASSCISRWGTEDMIGNLWEWTADWWTAGQTWQNDQGQSQCEFGCTYSGGWPAGYGADATWSVNGEAIHDSTYVSGIPAAAIRGCHFACGSQAGMFTMSLNNGPSDWSRGLGLRCCRYR